MRIRLRHFYLMMNTSLFKLSSVDFQSVFPPVFYYQFYFSLYTMQFVRGFEILSGMKPKINIWAKTQRLMNLMPMRQLEMDRRGKPLGTEIHSEVQSLQIRQQEKCTPVSYVFSRFLRMLLMCKGTCQIWELDKLLQKRAQCLLKIQGLLGSELQGPRLGIYPSLLPGYFEWTQKLRAPIDLQGGS